MVYRQQTGTVSGGATTRAVRPPRRGTGRLGLGLPGPSSCFGQCCPQAIGQRTGPAPAIRSRLRCHCPGRVLCVPQGSVPPDPLCLGQGASRSPRRHCVAPASTSELPSTGPGMLRGQPHLLQAGQGGQSKGFLHRCWGPGHRKQMVLNQRDQGARSEDSGVAGTALGRWGGGLHPVHSSDLQPPSGDWARWPRTRPQVQRKERGPHPGRAVCSECYSGSCRSRRPPPRGRGVAATRRRGTAARPPRSGPGGD